MHETETTAPEPKRRMHGLLAVGPDNVRRRPGLRRAAAFSGVMALAGLSSVGGASAAPHAPTTERVGLWSRALRIDQFVVELVTSTEEEERPASPLPGRDDGSSAELGSATTLARPAAPADAEVGGVVAAPDSEAWRSQQIAHTAGVGIMRPAGAGVVAVGFHEAAMAGALSLTPSWETDLQHGRSPVAGEVEGRSAGLSSLVLRTRGRATGPATAIDIAMEADTVVHAPLSGTVESVQPYLLYGSYPDTRIVIRPDDNPDVRVVLLHVTGATVAPGMHVEAGDTPIAAGPAPFPFASQIDEHVRSLVGHATPHVHVEVRR